MQFYVFYVFFLGGGVFGAKPKVRPWFSRESMRLEGIFAQVHQLIKAAIEVILSSLGRISRAGMI